MVLLNLAPVLFNDILLFGLLKNIYSSKFFWKKEALIIVIPS